MTTHRSSIARLLVSASILALAGCGAQGTTDEAEASLSAGGVPLIELFLTNSGRQDHFYTTDTTEAQVAVASGYVNFGNAARCFPTQVAGTVPLYRLYASGPVDHFYTIDPNEARLAAQYTYVSEGVACYVFNTNVGGTCPFYRYLYDGQGSPMTDHFYTQSARQGALAVQAGYRYEGIAAYLPPFGSTCPQ
jgi:uncharacterized protein DUF5648